MNSALKVTRRLTQAVLGAAAVGTLALTGHLALAHASASPSPATPPPTPSDKQPPAQSQPGTSSGSRSGFSQTPGLQGRASGGGSTTTHAS